MIEEGSVECYMHYIELAKRMVKYTVWMYNSSTGTFIDGSLVSTVSWVLSDGTVSTMLQLFVYGGLFHLRFQYVICYKFINNSYIRCIYLE